MNGIKNRSVVGNKSILIFGAGKIGRSFIGQLFGLSGYEVIFSDVDISLVKALNKRKSYPVIIKGEKEETLLIPNVRAVSGLDRPQIVKEISQVSLLAVSVGKNALEKVIPLIAEGLKMRYQTDKNRPLDIIIAENMRSVGEFIYKNLLSYLPEDYPIDRLVGLVETSIGKMVPIMQQSDLEQDPLMLFAEPYNNLIVDKKGFKGAIPEVNGLYPKENIKAWVDRKLFIHNLGHATVAYFGGYKHPQAIYIYEVLKDPEVYGFAKEVMFQAAIILQKRYPKDFSLKDLEAHIEDLLFRFQNKALKDTIFRVGQDRPRKLGPEDRFVGIIRLAISSGMNYDKILRAMAYALYFKETDENGNRSEADILFDNYRLKGLDFLLHKVCRLDPVKDEKIISELKRIYMTVDKTTNQNSEKTW
ncbi:Mannitol-1-phosphate 5-dehydrogenase [subsurface metagenome]